MRVLQDGTLLSEGVCRQGSNECLSQGGIFFVFPMNPLLSGDHTRSPKGGIPALVTIMLGFQWSTLDHSVACVSDRIQDLAGVAGMRMFAGSRRSHDVGVDHNIAHDSIRATTASR
jgi:hypothetical protein